MYLQHYNKKENISASNAWYQTFVQDISEQKIYPKIKTPTKGMASSAGFGILDDFLSRNVLEYEMLEIEGTGHFPHEEKPGEISKAISEFLN